MTVENFKYRTDPLFLRNPFSETGQYGIPMIPKPLMSKTDLQEIRFIGFDRTKTDKGKSSDRIVHFFLYDYEFEKLWAEPDKWVEQLKPYKAVLTPDFSMYLEMPDAVKLFNNFS